MNVLSTTQYHCRLLSLGYLHQLTK